jgi:hypothetical protein
MTNGPVAAVKMCAMKVEDRPDHINETAQADVLRQAAARQIAVETKRLWHEAQLAGLEDLALLMEEAFYRAYKEAGGAKVMRTV